MSDANQVGSVGADGLTPYERQRNQNIARNQEVLNQVLGSTAQVLKSSFEAEGQQKGKSKQLRTGLPTAPPRRSSRASAAEVRKKVAQQLQDEPSDSSDVEDQEHSSHRSASEDSDDSGSDVAIEDADVAGHSVAQAQKAATKGRQRKAAASSAKKVLTARRPAAAKRTSTAPAHPGKRGRTQPAAAAPPSDDEVQQLFDMFGPDSHGYVGKQQVLQQMERLGLDELKEKVDDMFKYASQVAGQDAAAAARGLGRLNIEQFRKLCAELYRQQ